MTDQNAKTPTAERAAEQFDNAIGEPVRAYGTLTTDYFEQLFSAQFDAVRAFADNSLAQSRSWLEVKDSDSFRQMVEQQQQSVQKLTERLKEDADKIRELSQEYLKDTQQLATASMQSGGKQIEENMRKGKEQVENSLQKGKAEADDTSQKSQPQDDKAKKTTAASK